MALVAYHCPILERSGWLSSEVVNQCQSSVELLVIDISSHFTTTSLQAHPVVIVLLIKRNRLLIPLSADLETFYLLQPSFSPPIFSTYLCCWEEHSWEQKTSDRTLPLLICLLLPESHACRTKWPLQNDWNCTTHHFEQRNISNNVALQYHYVFVVLHKRAQNSCAVYM